jgi:hypothetical protein
VLDQFPGAPERSICALPVIPVTGSPAARISAIWSFIDDLDVRCVSHFA